jgi:hypothetical protein
MTDVRRIFILKLTLLPGTDAIRALRHELTVLLQQIRI